MLGGALHCAGIDGLIDAPCCGAPPKIKPEETRELLELLEHPEEAQVTHWIGKKFHGFLFNELGFEIDYSKLVAWLHDRDSRLTVPQPWPDRQDENERQAFVERLQQRIANAQLELVVHRRDRHRGRSAPAPAFRAKERLPWREKLCNQRGVKRKMSSYPLR